MGRSYEQFHILKPGDIYIQPNSRALTVPEIAPVITSPTLKCPSYFDENSASGVIHNLQLKEAEGVKQTTIDISTYGGSIKEAVDLANYMTGSPLSIATRVINRCDSAGLIIAAAGRKGFRYSLPNSTFMIHPLAFTPPDLYLNRSEYNSLREAQAFEEENYLSIFERLTGTDRDVLRRYMTNGCYIFGPETAYVFGIIDYVLIPPSPSLIYRA